MPSVSFTYSQNAEEVFKFVTDPEQVRARCEAFGETDIVIDVV